MKKNISIEAVIRPILFIKNKLDRIVDPFLVAEIGITEAQFKILTPICFHKCVNQKEIATFWNISEAAVNRQVSYLIKKGLIKKGVDKNDLRKTNLLPTAKTEKLFKKIHPKIDAFLEDTFKGLSQNDRQQIFPVLQKMIKILNIDYPQPFNSPKQ